MNLDFESAIDLSELDWDFDDFNEPMEEETISVPDALLRSLENKGVVDLHYMEKLSKTDKDDIIHLLGSAIMHDPELWNNQAYEGWVTSEEYLSGDLLRKLKLAKEANKKHPGVFNMNVEKLEAILPTIAKEEKIYATLGSPWLPPKYVDQFIEMLFGKPKFYIGNIGKVQHDEATGYWFVPYLNRYASNPKVNVAYGTNRMNALQIIKHTLNNETVSVYDSVEDPASASGVKQVLNQAETTAVLEKQRLILETFQNWIWADPIRKENLETIFYNKFGVVRKRNFDGSFLTFPTMSQDVQLYPYQKDAVARIMFTPNTLLAHSVGAGKTFVMIAAGMEMLRIGKAQKLLYVVPNNVTGQWKEVFLQLYPKAKAKILCVTPNTFKSEMRDEVLTNIQKGEYEAVIMAYSCFEMIPLSFEYYRKKLSTELEALEKNARKNKELEAKLRKRVKKVSEELAKIGDGRKSKVSIFFDELGFDRLFVDEAHNFKNLPIESKVKGILGVNKDGSRKCLDLKEKVNFIQSHNGGGGVVFATATPITNSITDCFVFQQYLQSGMLALLGLNSFDAWVCNFAERTTNLEVAVDTNTYRLTTRYSRFHNLTELTGMLASMADFYFTDKENDIPIFKGYTDVIVKKSQAFEDYLKGISKRADDVQSGKVKRSQDNMLKLCSDGRKAALDIRLVYPEAEFEEGFKVSVCAENVYRIYNETKADSLTQLVFCDLATPKRSFNIYDELSSILIKKGVSPKEIAYIHEADSDRKRDSLLEKVRHGKIRILIGSTFKLGLGVNVQDKLVAIHHLDIPWKPSDLVQREGRLLRQGNTNSEVFIYRYITEGSFDAYSWQLLEIKQKFISALLSGSLTEEEAEDLDSVSLNYSELKALAVGNPLLKKRIETKNELDRFQTMHRKHLEAKIYLEQQIAKQPAIIENYRVLMEQCKEDVKHYQGNKVDLPKEQRRDIRKVLYEAVSANVMQPKDRVFINYQGFVVILPADMSAEKPYVRLKNKGTYKVELDKELGYLVRMDNCLEGLFERCDRLSRRYRDEVDHMASLQKEYDNNNGFGDKISALKEKLREIDLELEEINNDRK